MPVNSQLQEKLLAWFTVHGRDLPWRRTYAPYHVWISEIMLQQTQMDRAVEYFNRWIERLPDATGIARASEEEILKLWEGLGYYTRARNIQKCAAILVEEHDSTLPDDLETLLKLPGIGKYTAGAIMSLAFNRDCPIVDANIERVFARLFDIDLPVKTKEAQNLIWQKARDLIPSGKARYFNQALMELGALVCVPKNPQCRQCPIHTHCQSLRLGIVDQRPQPGQEKKIIPIEMATGVLAHQGKIFIQKRLENDVWANLWEFPGGRLEPGETAAHAVVREFHEETGFQVGGLRKIQKVRHGYTRYRVTLHCYFCRLLSKSTTPVLTAAQEYRWVTPEELTAFAFPSGHRKLIASLLDEGNHAFRSFVAGKDP